MSSTKYVKHEDELQQLLWDPKIEVKNVSLINEKVIQVSLEPKYNFHPPSLKTQVFIASYVRLVYSMPKKNLLICR